METTITKKILMLVCIVVIVYSNTLDSDFVWDDIVLIRDNPALLSPQNLMPCLAKGFFDTPAAPPGAAKRPSYWRPLVTISFAVDHHLSGGAPFGYHITNLFLHALNSVLVLLLCDALFPAAGIGLPTALIFALHPLQTNAVAYISGRTDLLSAAFLFLSCLTLIRALDAWRRACLNFLFTAIFLSLSLLAKEMGIIAPLLYLVIGMLSRHNLKRRLTGAVILAFSVIAAYASIRSLLDLPLARWAGRTDIISLPHLLAVAESLILYAGLFLFPVGLHMERFISLPPPANPAAILCLLLVVASLAAAARGLSRRRSSAYLYLWSFITILPVINIVPLYPDIAKRQLFLGEQFLYLPSFGAAAIAALAWKSILRDPRRAARLARSVGVILLSLLGILSYAHNYYWRDEYSFYSRTLRFYPGSVRMRINLGLLHARDGRFKEGIQMLSLVAEANPLSAQVHLNLGCAYRMAGDPANARAELSRANELCPGSAHILNEIALVELAEGNLDKASDMLEKARDASTQNLASRFNLAIIYMRKGEADKAEKMLREVLSIDHNSVEARLLLDAMSGKIKSGNHQPAR